MMLIYLIFFIYAIIIFIVTIIMIHLKVKSRIFLSVLILISVLCIVPVIIISKKPIVYHEEIIEIIQLSEFESLKGNINKFLIIDNSGGYPKFICKNKSNQQLYLPLEKCKLYDAEGTNYYILVIKISLYKGNIYMNDIQLEYRIFLPNKNKYIVLYKESALS